MHRHIEAAAEVQSKQKISRLLIDRLCYKRRKAEKVQLNNHLQ